MVAPNLDLDTLRTLVVAHDLGGYRQAAERLGRTPSAISLQMKRLQEAVGAVLFRREGRGLALTEAGEIVLRHGRQMLEINDHLLATVRGAALSGRVRLGCSQDFADTVLPKVLGQFGALFPLVQMEVRIDGNAVLADAVEAGQLDIALCVGQAGRACAEVVGELGLAWIAGPGFKARPDQPLPLALLGPKCAFRKAAIEGLDAAGQAWRIAAVSPSLAGLWAAAAGGLGVTVRTALGVPVDLALGERLFGLPALGRFAVTVQCLPERSEGVRQLHALIREAVRVALLSEGRASIVGRDDR